MGRETIKIVISLLGAGALAFCALLLMQGFLFSGRAAAHGVDLFRFQLSVMIAWAIFAGSAIVIYARLSRYSPERTRRRRGSPGAEMERGPLPNGSGNPKDGSSESSKFAE